jgi:tellurite resistance protein TehA-like permease
MTAAVLADATPRLFRDLDRPGRIVEHLTPNWFASIMGTGIVANAAATLPLQTPLLHTFATAVWGFAATALVALTIAFAAHWILHTDNARGYLVHPVVGLFYGAIPMALVTVGSGTLLLGKEILGAMTALWIAGILWAAGTLTGLATALCIPVHTSDHRLPALLMPVVPPMVSATGGALLAQHLSDGPFRTAFLVACYALFVVSLILGARIMVKVCRELMHRRMPPVQAIPTVWITLGLVGQSVTAATLLAVDAGAQWLHDIGVVYGIAAGAFGIVMFTVATLLTITAARNGLRFSMTWWSFTFPVGTCVTGATALGATFGALNIVAVVLYALLVTAWAVVASSTVRGTLSGRIFLPA